MYINNDIDYLKYLKEKEIIIFGAGIEGKKWFTRLKNGYRITAFCDNDTKNGDNRYMILQFSLLKNYVK